MGNDIGLGPALYLDNNFSNTFSLFQLESKSYRTKQCLLSCTACLRAKSKQTPSTRTDVITH